MGNMHNIIMDLCKAKGVSGYRMCKDVGIQPSILTDLKMGRQKSLTASTAEKVASYFGVSVGYLLGKEETPTIGDSRSSDDITFDDFTYAMYNESKQLSAEDKEMLLSFAKRLRERVESESKQTGGGNNG